MTAEPNHPTHDPVGTGEDPQDRPERTTQTDSCEESGRYTPRNESRVSGIKLPEIDFKAFQSSLYEQINTLHEQLAEMKATQEAHLAELMTLQSEQREALNSMFSPANQPPEPETTQASLQAQEKDE